VSSADITIQHEAGLHARPAALFVKTASGFQSKVSVTFGAKTANAKSIVQVLGLGARQGATISISAEGPDEQAAVEALTNLIQSNFEVA